MFRPTRLTLTILAAFLVALMAVPASAQAPYPLSGALTCDRSVTPPGSTVRCQADGFAAQSAVDVVATGGTADLAGESSFAAGTWEFVTTVIADATGVATAFIQVPSDAVGPASVSFTGIAPDSSTRTLRSVGAFTVVAAPAGAGDVDGAAGVGGDAAGGVDTSAGGGVLSNTGAPVLMGSIAAIVLLLGGASLVLVGRRRRQVLV